MRTKIMFNVAVYPHPSLAISLLGKTQHNKEYSALITMLLVVSSAPRPSEENILCAQQYIGDNIQTNNKKGIHCSKIVQFLLASLDKLNKALVVALFNLSLFAFGRSGSGWATLAMSCMGDVDVQLHFFGSIFWLEEIQLDLSQSKHYTVYPCPHKIVCSHILVCYILCWKRSWFAIQARTTGKLFSRITYGRYPSSLQFTIDVHYIVCDRAVHQRHISNNCMRFCDRVQVENLQIGPLM